MRRFMIYKINVKNMIFVCFIYKILFSTSKFSKIVIFGSYISFQDNILSPMYCTWHNSFLISKDFTRVLITVHSI